ncbi:Piso0_005442 [Millerozyma farinosa CBS 7064]|uniref:Piso0_005442 protein n=1 Tax=Pichia sorbitophila (strain ATCC MYA-4447 / BCRC 22081 / CBS 7064 / NBRC 10061 / NRRL Y-12695) TaxID=559304 RepID=G8XZ10_PICSO|nr:Piso0_005442 [Millerozyma farinosa CBS 7064]
MSDPLYSHREQQNDQRFDQLAQTLHQFRNTVSNDIRGVIQQENSTLDLLNDGFSQLMTQVKRTSGNLTTVLKRNANLTRLVGGILLIFFVIWMLFKLR